MGDRENIWSAIKIQTQMHPNAMLHASPCSIHIVVLKSSRFLRQATKEPLQAQPKDPKDSRLSVPAGPEDVKRCLVESRCQWKRRRDGPCHLPFAVIAVSRPLAAQARQHERVHPQLQHPLRSEGLAKSYHPYTANYVFDQTVLEYKLSLPLTAVFPLHYSITAAPHSCLATFMILYRCVRTTMYILLAW